MDSSEVSHDSAPILSLPRRSFMALTAALGATLSLGASAARATVSASGTPRQSFNSATGLGLSPRSARLGDFSELLGETFQIRTSDGLTTSATLAEAEPLKFPSLRFRRKHFSVVFELPSAPEIAQDTYRVTHPRLGTLDLLMVPVDRPTSITRLEALFS